MHSGYQFFVNKTYKEAIANKLQHTSSSNAERGRRRAYSLSVATLCLRIPASSPKSRNNWTLEEEAEKKKKNRASNSLPDHHQRRGDKTSLRKTKEG
jgi:hypothetical protein